MKKYYLISLLALCSTSYLVPTERNVIYHLPSDDVLNKAFQDAGLTDFMKNSKLIENLKQYQIYPSEVGSFIQVAYRDYYTYLDSWSPVTGVGFFPSVDPVLGSVYLATGGLYWNILNKMHTVIQNRQQLYRILLQDYPSELLRLQDLGIIDSVSAPMPQVASNDAWADPYGLIDEEVEPQPVPLRDDEEAQRLPDSVLYKIGSENDEKYQLTLPTALQIQEYDLQGSSRLRQQIMNYFYAQENDQNEIARNANMLNDIVLRNRLVEANFLEKLQNVIIHPTEIGSFVEMLYAQEFENLYNFSGGKPLYSAAANIAVMSTPVLIPMFKSMIVMMIRQHWLPTGKQYELYESLLKNNPSELVRLEQIGIYNSLHSVAGYL